jgi:predicted  nucleic acid-binding Zn-ribbon protein
MNQSTTFTTPTSEPGSQGDKAANLKLSIAQYFTEIDAMREQMSRDQVEIEHSQKRTRALLADLKNTLSSAGRKAV